MEHEALLIDVGKMPNNKQFQKLADFRKEFAAWNSFVSKRIEDRKLLEKTLPELLLLEETAEGDGSGLRGATFQIVLGK